MADTSKTQTKVAAVTRKPHSPECKREALLLAERIGVNDAGQGNWVCTARSGTTGLSKPNWR